jgi:peptidoglycan/xylan/chitin deacetylase (PgdA/CDA1 family)
VPTWDPQWSQLGSTGAWWAEFQVAGGGALTTAVTIENVATGAIHPLSYSYGRWTGGVTNLVSGTQVVMHATNALGATARTMPFPFLVTTAPVTNPCGGTAATNSTCQPLARGMVTFSFDDSGPSQPTIAIPLLQRYGVKGTFFVVPQWHDWTPLARTLLADGHEFAAHGMTHQTLTTLTPQQLDDELRLSKAWIQTNIGGTVDSFATPSAAFNATVITAVKGYFGNHRGGEEDLNFVGTDVYRLQSDFMYNTSTVAKVCARIQQAAAQRGWLFLTFHDFTNDASSTQGFTVPAAIFEGILACATTTPGIDVVTARQATAAIRCGSPP